MSKKEFNAIVEKLQRNEISRAEATQQLNRLKEQRANGKTTANKVDQLAEIAVIGMSGQFADAKNVTDFWENLAAGRDSIKELPEQYLEKQYYSPEKMPGKSYCKWGGVLEERDCFDPLFFNIAPREAESMNPHQRVILQESWKGLEDAGYNPKTLSEEMVGIFIGAEPTGYGHESFTGFSDAIVASRLSYYLNLNGPAIIVNTGCSSSGVAIHLACENLRSKESSMAIAGGVYTKMDQPTLISLSETGMLSPTGRCHTFDEAADGMVMAEGAGVVVLKRLNDAVSDNDRVYGVISGSGINQDGASNGITAPNGIAQERLILDVYKRFNINPETIGYIEAHGTGTALGDPVEANALIRAFKKLTNKQHYCVVGSAKSNIGHSLAAAGVIGLIKILLSLKHKTIPGLLHFKKLNPMINFAGSPFYINTEATSWKTEEEQPRVAALNSFGHSGTNAHIVVREYRSAKRETPRLSPVLVPISARNAERLREQAENLLRFLRPDNTQQAAEIEQKSSEKQTAKPITQKQLERQIQQTVAAMLQVEIEEIDPTENPDDYGLEQLHRTELQKSLAETLKVEINLDEMLQAESITTMAKAIIETVQKSQTEKESQPKPRPETKTPPVDLTAMAYTLQTGREAMEERVIFLVKTVPELITGLEAFLKGSKTIKNCWQGDIRQNKKIGKLLDGEGPELMIQHWISAGQYEKLANLWTHGMVFDWRELYGEEKPVIISLPTYPFAKERYWIPDTIAAGPGNETATVTEFTSQEVIHPLVHRNLSDLFGQRYGSLFTGQEFFLNDHRVRETKILPGVAYTEMARAAISEATRTSNEQQARIRLKDVVWIQPIAVENEPVPVEIELFPETNGEIRYEVRGVSSTIDTPPVHSQGRAAMVDLLEQPTVNLEAWRESCDIERITAEECYEAFQTMGIQYGPGHRGVREIFVGDGAVLAKLTLPSELRSEADRYILHPCMMDSALQASVGLMKHLGAINQTNSEDLNPVLPFSLRELEIFAPCEPEMWVALRYSSGSGATDKVQKMDLDLTDSQGRVCVRMKEFSSRMLENTEDRPLVGNLELAPIWEVCPTESGEQNPTIGDSILIIGGTEENQQTIRRHYPQALPLKLSGNGDIEGMKNSLNNLGNIDHIILIAPRESVDSAMDERLIEQQNEGVFQCFRLLKALLQLGYGEKSLGLTFITTKSQAAYDNDSFTPTHATLHGLIGSTAKEYSNWKIRLVDLETEKAWPVKELFQLPHDPQGDARLYRNGQWYKQRLTPVEYTPNNQSLYKQGGVYIIIGGAGGIGEAWTESMIRDWKAQVVWIGRRKEDDTIRTKLNRLANLGPKPIYITVDATDRQALQTACDEVKQRCGKINGVIHSAIVLSDQSLSNMEEQRFRMGLSAKVDISVRIAQVFEKEPVDFILFFSSMQSFSKTPGQSNYAAGCTFKDAFALRLAQQLPYPVKVMNWGYWGTVGIVASDEYRERMKKAGIGSIEIQDGMSGVDKLLTGPLTQIALLNTTKPLTVQEANIEEKVVIYNENGPSLLNSLNTKQPQEESRIQQMKEEGHSAEQSMNHMMSRLLWAQLCSMGLFRNGEATLKECAAQLKLTGLYQRWLEASLTLLEEKGYLKKSEERYIPVSETTIDPETVRNEWNREKAEWLKDPNREAQVLLLETTLKALPEILTGNTPATDIMFPNSSMKLVEGIYKNNLVADFFNETLADLVVAFIKEKSKQDPTAKVRILEVGAGTGGTSSVVFQKLADYRNRVEEYCYTDLSQAFLMHAEREFLRENPYLTLKIFDASQSIIGQNIEANRYDLAIATNVLHATQNIRQTLRNIKPALKRDGVLLLNEMSSNTLFTHLTFGLLEGWWLYEDSELRISGSPALSPRSWRQVLESEGFPAPRFPTENAHALGQQIIAAPSDGVNRVSTGTPGISRGTANANRRNETVTAKPIETTQEVPKTGQTSIVESTVKQNSATGNLDESTLREKSITKFKQVIGEVLKISPNNINSSEQLEQYGVDSILVVQLTNKLRDVFEEIQSTLFFEAQTIDALVDYFMTNRKEALTEWVAPETLTTGNRVTNPPGNRSPETVPTKSTGTNIAVPSLNHDLDPGEFREKSVAWFKKQVGEVLKISANNINSSEPLEQYGIDSILVVQLTNKLREVFSDVQSTLFFEVQTIDALVDHFMNEERETLLREVGGDIKTIPKEEQKRSTPAPTFRTFESATRQQKPIAIKKPEATIPEKEDIAIIGLSGRYPQAGSIRQFWEALKAGKNSITEIPEDRWRWQDYYDEEKGKPGKMYTKWGGFLDDIAGFDPLFFKISPAEAEMMDPQERLFLETAYETIEDAGYYPEKLSKNRKVGVFVGAMNANYPTGVSFWSISNRVSWIFNFQGPSMTVDTACSSSLTAIHLAVESLQNGTCECAVAGGVNLIVAAPHYLRLTSTRMLSPSNQCKSFGDQADGFVDGEGVGAVLLKPLNTAIEAGDQIYGVIRGTMVNAAGRTNGYTVPNPNAQAQLVADALKRANVHPEEVSYLEAHGTGTSLGDPIEIAGLKKAFETKSDKKQFCAIGSAKSNIGHCESAAGIAGITKVLLQMKHKQLVPSLHSERINPNIDFANSPFVLQQKLKSWEQPLVTIDGKERQHSRIAGISSFGAGGANAHIVIEEYTDNRRQNIPTLSSQEPVAIVLSAKNEECLGNVARRLSQFIEEEQLTDESLPNMAYTLQVGRKPMEQRLAMMVDSIETLRQKLSDYIDNKEMSDDRCHGNTKQSGDALSMFMADDDLLFALDSWIAKGKYSKLLDLWVKGVAIDWTKLYPAGTPVRMSLPTYPFEKNHYWAAPINFQPEKQQSPTTAVQKRAKTIEKDPVKEKQSIKENIATNQSKVPESRPTVGLKMLIPVWDATEPAQKQITPDITDRLVLIGGSDETRNTILSRYPDALTPDIQPEDSIERIEEQLRPCGTINHIIRIAPEECVESLTTDSLIEKQNQGVIHGFRLFKAMAQLGYDQQPLGWTILTTQAQSIQQTDHTSPVHTSIHGLVGSVAKEQPNWAMRLIDLEMDQSLPIDTILTLPADRQGRAWVFRKNTWYRQKLIASLVPKEEKVTYRKGGVYIIIGGAGSIGEAWSEYMIRTWNAQIVWIGRREKDETIQQKLDALAKLGPAPHYIAADATDRDSFQQACETVKQRYSQINGVIHSALVFWEQKLVEMEEEGFRAALAAKVDVSVRMAQVLEKEPLDFLLFFSSSIAFVKNPGQSHYASGCTFKDAFALRLAKEWSCPVKIMNWGFFDSNVGGDADSEFIQQLANIGIDAIKPKEGMEALEKLLSASVTQAGLMKTTKPLLLEGETKNEFIDIYKERFSSNLKKMDRNLASQRTEEELEWVESVKSKGDQFTKEMDTILCKLLLGHLRSIGLFQTKSTPVDELLKAGGQVVGDEYQRWLEESIAVLVRNNHLRIEGDHYVQQDETPIDPEAAWADWNRAKSTWIKDPNQKAQAILVEETIRELPKILTGKLLATEVMFPNSSMKLVEDVYKQTNVPDYFNRRLADTVLAYIQEQIDNDPSAKIRILEIGAGTGGTSVVVFEKLKDRQELIREYCYTDISKAFLLHAEREYGKENPFLTYRIFDAGQPIAGQEIEADAYDLVIATNVLHATPNIRQTLRNAKAVLKKNGLLLLNEMSCNSLFSHLTFGLLEGWWLYEDPELRIPGCPGLSPENWQAVLHGEGFRTLLFPAEEAHGLGLQVVVAESDGVVRQEWIRQENRTRTNQPQEQKAVQQPEQQEIPEAGQTAEEFLTDVLLEKLSAALKVQADSIDPDETFSDYGLDSIIGVNLVQEINQALALDLETTSLFEYNTVAQLLDHILKEYRKTVEAAMPKIDSITLNSGDNVGEDQKLSTTDNVITINDEMLELKIRETVLEKLSESLKIEIGSIDQEETFSDYGLDSIIGVNLVQEINQTLNLELETTSLFEYNTVNLLVDFIHSEHAESLRQLLTKATSMTSTSGASTSAPLISDSSAVVSEEATKQVTQVKTEKSKNLRKQTRKSETESSGSRETERRNMAVIGLAGQFPMANNADQFWQNIAEGKDCIAEIPKDRWDWEAIYGDPTEDPSKTRIKWGGFIDGVADFDPLFFGIAPREASFMDPQQRLLMTCTWNAMEDAGIHPKELAKEPTGVFIATGPSEYLNIVSIPRDNPYIIMAPAPSVIPNRISYTLNLKGPSEYYEMACSSAVIALHRAIQSIRNHECEQAIIGAVNLLLSPMVFMGLESSGYLSLEGKTKSFQDDANGYVRSEGVGTMIIKPLEKAIADQNQIYAVIKGTGVAHGGKGMSLSAPNATGMKTAMLQAYRDSDIDPRSVSYIEAHGIASELGDGIEINALKSGYQELVRHHDPDTIKKSPCYISTLKPCIGHGEMVSGMAALIKVIFAINNRTIPGVPRFGKLNPHIALEGSPLKISAENQNWTPTVDTRGNTLPRRASINSYGTSGVSAHVVLEEYQPVEVVTNSDTAQIIVLSAKNRKRLTEAVERLLAFVKERETVSLPNLAYTLQTGRAEMESRFAMVADSRDSLLKGLEQFLKQSEDAEDEQTTDTSKGNPMFSGKTGEKMVQLLLAEQELEKLALHWQQGGSIPWKTLHAGKPVRTVSLPTYPFEKRRCWIDSDKKEPTTLSDSVEHSGGMEAVAIETGESKEKAANNSPKEMEEVPAKQQIMEIVCHLLGMTTNEVKPETPLSQYGFDSILLMQLLQQLKSKVDPSLDLIRLQTCKTLKDVQEIASNLTNFTVSNGSESLLPTGEAGPFSSLAIASRFPELIHLNQSNQGKPVFWIHSGQGGVEVYREIAEKSERPFYGIQAKGWMTDRTPLKGLQTMASYYSRIIQTIQPEGPYDLGGFSLGGTLAYEVVRQLQELGEKVDTLVMLDSLDSTGLKKEKNSEKTALLQAVNTALIGQLQQDPEVIAKVREKAEVATEMLIHRKELEPATEEGTFLKRLVAIATKRGLTKTEEQVQAMVDQASKVQNAYNVEHFSVQPLPNPEAVTCYYFRNKNGLLFGEMEPYFSIREEGETSPLDKMNYWNEWVQNLSDLHLMDVDASNHFSLLVDPNVSQTITNFCETLYAQQELPIEFLQTFKQEIIKTHGTMES